MAVIRRDDILGQAAQHYPKLPYFQQAGDIHAKFPGARGVYLVILLHNAVLSILIKCYLVIK
jgi:hypothetical protein